MEYFLNWIFATSRLNKNHEQNEFHSDLCVIIIIFRILSTLFWWNLRRAENAF